MEPDDILRVSVPILAFAWCLFELAHPPWGNYRPWRSIIGAIVLLGACVGAYLLLRGDLLPAIFGALLAGLVALGASHGLVEKMQARRKLTPVERDAQQAGATPLRTLVIPALIGLLGLASALIDQL